MSEKKDNPNICKSIFKNGESSISKTHFTKAYIDLVQQLERPDRHYAIQKER